MHWEIADAAGCAPQALRRLFGSYASGVAVIGASGADGRLVGMTVNSFGSVSLSPPLVMYCPAKSLGAFDVYASAEFFSISVLSAGQQRLSERFARPGVGKWDTVAHETGPDGTPVIRDALAAFECRTVQRVDAGDHLIVIGRIQRCSGGPPHAPLLFHGGRYGRLVDEDAEHARAQAQIHFQGWGG